MTHEDLIAALDRYGGDPSTWPEPMASAARAAEEADPAFRAALAEQRALDALLTRSLAPEPLPLGYATRIAARAAEEGRRRTESWIPRWLIAVGSGWAVATLAAGIVYSHLVASVDPELLQLAELGLDAASIITGN